MLLAGLQCLCLACAASSITQPKGLGILDLHLMPGSVHTLVQHLCPDGDSMPFRSGAETGYVHVCKRRTP